MDATTEAIGVLAREKSLAEQFAIILKTHAGDDFDVFAQGIALYAEAKAGFDGLIEQLLFELASGDQPEASPRYTEALRAAVEHRVAFTEHVDAHLISGREGAKFAVGDWIKAASDLIPNLIRAGLDIWKAYAEAGQARRAALRDQIEGLRWAAFADLQAAG